MRSRRTDALDAVHLFPFGPSSVSSAIQIAWS